MFWREKTLLQFIASTIWNTSEYLNIPLRSFAPIVFSWMINTKKEEKMNELKYVIMIPPGFNKLGARAIIFNGLFTHSIVAKGFLEEGWTLNSAGFLDLNNDVICSGRSESLNCESDKFFDQIIISQTILKQHPLIGFIK